MNIRIISYFVIVIVVFSGCKLLKKTASDDSVAKNKQQDVVILTEQNKIEFEFYYIEGLKQKMLGNNKAAIQYFNQCLAINPHSAASLYELANIYVMEGDIISARLLLEQAIEINPDNKWYKLLLARIYQNNDEFLKASNIYEQLIANDPGNIELYFINAMFLNSAGEYSDALKVYDEIEELIGYDEQIALARQNIYRQNGKDKEAYAEIEKLIAQYPDVPEYYGIMADMYKEDGKMEKAREYYLKVLELDPQNGFVHFSLATFYIQENNFDEAYIHAKKGFAHPDVEFETKIQLYILLVTAPEQMYIGDEKMITLIEEIIATHPQNAQSYAIMVDFLTNKKRFEEAKQYILQAIEADPNSFQNWEQLIFIDNQLRDFEQMEEHSNEAILLFPAQPSLYVLNAIAKIQLEKYPEALQTLQSGEIYAAGDKKIEAQFAMYKAEALYNMNEKDKAFEAFEDVLEIDPENYLVLNNYAYYLSLHAINLDKAEKMSGKVIQAFPENPTYLDTHAWVLFKKGEYRLAKFYMDSAIKNGGDSSDVVVEHYGDILFKMDKIEEAIEYWKKSLEMGNKSEILKQKIETKTYISED